MFSFFSARGDMIKFIRSMGGMHTVYKDLIESFQSIGFQIREVSDDSIYLHYGTSESKCGIQLVQIDRQNVQLVVGEETKQGQSHSFKLQESTSLDSQEVVIKVLRGLRYSDLEVEDDVEEGYEDSITWDFLLSSSDVDEEVKGANRKFLKPDDIDPDLFSQNMQIITDSAFYEAGGPVYAGSASMTKFSSLPKAYPIWFAAGYPDVMVWFMDAFQDKSSVVFKTVTSNVHEYMKDYIFTLAGLRKLIDLYKRLEEKDLECAID